MNTAENIGKIVKIDNNVILVLDNQNYIHEFLIHQWQENFPPQVGLQVYFIEKQWVKHKIQKSQQTQEPIANHEKVTPPQDNKNKLNLEKQSQTQSSNNQQSYLKDDYDDEYYDDEYDEYYDDDYDEDRAFNRRIIIALIIIAIVVLVSMGYKKYEEYNQYNSYEDTSEYNNDYESACECNTNPEPNNSCETDNNSVVNNSVETNNSDKNEEGTPWQYISSSEYTDFYFDKNSLQKVIFEEGLKKGNTIYRVVIKSYPRSDSDIVEGYKEPNLTELSHSLNLYYIDCSADEFVEIYREDVDVNNNIANIIVNSSIKDGLVKEYSNGWEVVDGDTYYMPALSNAICKLGNNLNNKE